MVSNAGRSKPWRRSIASTSAATSCSDRPARTNADCLRYRGAEAAPGFAQRCDFGFVFHDSLALDDPLGRQEHRTRVGTPERRRRRCCQRDGETVESADRHPRGFDSDSPRATLSEHSGQRLVVTLGRHDQRNFRGHIRCRHERPRGCLVSKVHDQRACRRRQHDEPGGTDKTCQVADVRQMRHDQRIHLDGAHALARTRQTGNDRRCCRSAHRRLVECRLSARRGRLRPASRAQSLQGSASSSTRAGDSDSLVTAEECTAIGTAAGTADGEGAAGAGGASAGTS